MSTKRLRQRAHEWASQDADQDQEAVDDDGT
jgi:hypothetical protein